MGGIESLQLVSLVDLMKAIRVRGCEMDQLQHIVTIRWVVLLLLPSSHQQPLRNLERMRYPPSSVATDDAVTNGNREVRRLCLAVLVGGSHYKHHSSIMTMNVKICYSQAFVLMRRNIGN